MFETEHGISAEEGTANSVTVVVCAYTNDRWVTRRRALDVALQQISLYDELLVVVDHNDVLLAQCQESFGNAKILSNYRKRGLSGARNTALDVAQGSIIVFLDDDVVPFDGWLDALRVPYADMHVYGVGGLAKPHWRGVSLDGSQKSLSQDDHCAARRC